MNEEMDIFSFMVSLNLWKRSEKIFIFLSEKIKMETPYFKSFFSVVILMETNQ